MRHPRFNSLGDGYPLLLEQHYERILIRIDQLWDRAELHDYFSDLLIDKRGGRKGFPKGVLSEIIVLREFREMETFREAEKSEGAIRELNRRGINLKRDNFFKAINDGNQELVDLFVRANFNINGPDENGNLPLMLALKKGYTVVARILLMGGADFGVKDKLGLTPLLVACGKTTQGYKAIAEMLIMKGAYINVRDTLGFSPLLLSLSGGSMEIARLLIDRGADVLVGTRKGDTALSLARKSTSAEAAGVVELLINKGAML